MMLPKKFYVLTTLAFMCLLVAAQPKDSIPIFRQGFHDKVDKQQTLIDQLDGKKDKNLSLYDDWEKNFYISQAVFGGVDSIQRFIEKCPLIPKDQEKKRYLVVTEALLKNYYTDVKASRFNTSFTPRLIQTFSKTLEFLTQKKSIDSLIDAVHYEIANLIYISIKDYFPADNIRLIVIRKYCDVYPDKVFLKLREVTDVPFLDSLIKVAGYRSPLQLYNFAQGNNKLSNAIRKIDDPLVHAVSQMATSNSGQQFFPFLDNIVKGKMTIADVSSVMDDSVKYFQLLVKTHIEYVDRAMKKDTAYGYAELEDRMKRKALDVFVNTINGLHEVDDPNVRFKIIQPLSAEELYYLAVLTDGEIYTSSFVKGVYPQMMNKAHQRGDSLLMNLRFDKYRKFIKMAAGYNTLNNFLSTFPASKDSLQPSDAKNLMRAFVNGLEKSNSLEAGVDVADSYASIVETNKEIADEMLVNVQRNYEINLNRNNKRGTVIYNLLSKLFLSADTTNHIDISNELHIPPVYSVPFNALANDSGRVVMQVFFYGNKDGQGIFPGFLNLFNSPNWKIDKSNPQWVSITSLKGKPISVYANKPLPEEDDEDTHAQYALDSFLQKKGLLPTVVIHRGHSFSAGYTIEQILPSAKIVFMGSCGGYHLIHDILRQSPDAHIIASKQIGKTAVNQPFFSLLMEKIRNGNNIEWIPFWDELEKILEKQKRTEGFEDYIPPYKNLGAIFIKAYKIAMGNDE